MKKYLKPYFIALLWFGLFNLSYANSWLPIKRYTQPLIERIKEVKIQLRAGYNLGGMLPTPMPQEIRKIESYNPTLNLNIEARGYYPIPHTPMALGFGLRFEQKGMQTLARVKNYQLLLSNADGTSLTGNFTGEVSTKAKASYLTLPLVWVYQFNPYLSFSLGGFYSRYLEGNFTGEARHGYLREGSPIGEKQEIENASYDFSNAYRKHLWGLQAGITMRFYKKLSLTTELSYGFNNVFDNQFKGISFPLHPLYANIGVAYTF